MFVGPWGAAAFPTTPKRRKGEGCPALAVHGYEAIQRKPWGLETVTPTDVFRASAGGPGSAWWLCDRSHLRSLVSLLPDGIWG